MEYKFKYEDEEYIILKENCEYILNDEEKEVKDFELDNVLELLNKCDEVFFDKEYYSDPCEVCLEGKKEKLKFFKFLEYHFYIFTKEENYVISSISEEYKNTSFMKLLRDRKIDNSYIVSIIYCPYCKKYTIEIEQCEM